MTGSTAKGRPKCVKGIGSDNKKSTSKSFVAFDKDAEITYEFVATDDKPVKLGDGTFGCVFHVRGMNKNFALKIFYDTDDDLIASSQKREMEVGRSLHHHYIDQQDTAAATKEFTVGVLNSY
ncbi:MAG: hypothetical protein OXC63_11355 [Aestuariivita sp.]|nr:hypothetical protein [Aestuariivita sp.]MCY4347393.1 hypothetical protein [Aestuariivita sp.]